MKFKISLFKLYNEINTCINNGKKFGTNNNYCKYNKDIFPGLIFYLNDSKINITIFEAGKVVFSGTKKRKEIKEIFKSLYPLIIESKNTNIDEK